MIDYKIKFYKFETIVKCILGGKNIKISDSNYEGSVRLYSFGYSIFYYQFCVGKKISDFIYHLTTTNRIGLLPETIIKNLSITFISDYNHMIPKHYLQQPRRVMEPKLIKHISNASTRDKLTKSRHLSLKLNL